MINLRNAPTFHGKLMVQQIGGVFCRDPRMGTCVLEFNVLVEELVRSKVPELAGHVAHGVTLTFLAPECHDLPFLLGKHGDIVRISWEYFNNMIIGISWVCLKMGYAWYAVNTIEMDVSMGKPMINQWMEWNIPLSDRPMKVLHRFIRIYKVKAVEMIC